MKYFIALSAILTVCVALPIEEDELVSVKLGSNKVEDLKNFQSTVLISNGVFETPLDHFQPTDPRRLRLTYRANVEHFEENGPLFFFIDDGVSGTQWIERGLVVDLARELKGAVISADIKYFGRNRWGNTTVENLRFYTIDHVLADLPHLVNKVKDDLDSARSRVVVFGPRLGGTIAALARKKFPHIIDGIWSSSGIFRAVSVEETFYNTVAWNVYNRGPQNCSAVLSATLNQVRALVEARNNEVLQRLFNLCAPVNFENPQEVQYFYETVFNFIATYIDQRHHAGIQEFCRDLTFKNDTLRAFGRWARHVFGSDDDECANISYSNAINSLRNVTNPISARRSQYFQCTQFGLNFRITPENGFGNVFPAVITQAYHDQWCSDIFGDVFNRTLLERAANNINVQHGSQNQVISNAIFSNGNLDPFLEHGIAEYDIDNSEAVVTQSVGSAADLDSISEADSRELTVTKETIVAALKRFVTPLGEDDDNEEEEEEEGDDDDEGEPLKMFY